MDDEKTIAVRTTHGEAYLHADFQLINNQPFGGMVKIVDNVDQRIYWFNIDHLIWVGPR